MPWNNERMLTDADGNLIPQVWDPSQNKFVPYEAKVQLSGTIVEIGLLADRPTATPENKGMGYFAWDAPEGNKLTYSDGTKWVVI